MRIARLNPRWVLALLMAISIILPAWAREKKDVVILKNGDRITCEIKKLERGMLTAKTDSMSTVEIKWQDVERITSNYFFTVHDDQGRIYVGSLQPAAEKQRVDVTDSQTANNLDHMSIVDIQELGSSRWTRFSGSAELGYTFTKASDLTQFNFAGDVEYQAKSYSGQLSYSSTLGKSEGETDADRKLLTLAGTRQLSGKWIGYMQAAYEHNLELQLDRRFSLLAGPGYRIKHNNRSQVTAVAAASYSRENYIGEDVTKNIEGFFAIDTQFFKLYSPKFDIVNQFAFLPNFSTRGRRRLQYSSRLRLEIVRDFFITLTFYDSYDSKPPSLTASKNDYGFTTGLSWSFRR